LNLTAIPAPPSPPFGKRGWGGFWENVSNLKSFFASGVVRFRKEIRIISALSAFSAVKNSGKVFKE
jgi:hypothetical protein